MGLPLIIHLISFIQTLWSTGEVKALLCRVPFPSRLRKFGCKLYSRGRNHTFYLNKCDFFSCFCVKLHSSFFSTMQLTTHVLKRTEHNLKFSQVVLNSLNLLRQSYVEIQMNSPNQMKRDNKVSRVYLQ